jgi:hypothetical protein
MRTLLSSIASDDATDTVASVSDGDGDGDGEGDGDGGGSDAGNGDDSTDWAAYAFPMRSLYYDNDGGDGGGSGGDGGGGSGGGSCGGSGSGGGSGGSGGGGGSGGVARDVGAWLPPSHVVAYENTAASILPFLLQHGYALQRRIFHADFADEGTYMDVFATSQE